MVTLAVAAILATLAIPSFIQQLRQWQRDGATKAFATHVHLARSEAIKTSRRVVMCASSNGAVCADSNEWLNGWIVFHDVDGDGEYDNEETMVAVRGASNGLTSMEANGNIQQLIFLPNGLMASTSTTLQVRPPGGASIKMNEVTVNRIGRVYIKATEQGD